MTEGLHTEPAGTGAVDAGNAGLCIDALATMPAATIIDEQRMAVLWGVTDRAVRRMVRRRELPPGIRLRGKTCWLAGKVLAHIEARADAAARAAEREAARIRSYSP